MLAYYALHAQAKQHRHDLLREAKLARKLHALAQPLQEEAAPPGPGRPRRVPALALVVPAGTGKPAACD